MKQNNFNLMRLALSVMVVISHSYPVAGHDEPTYFHMSLGMLAVHGFFCISGYLITQSFVRNPDVLTFAWHRFLRIVPGLVAASAFSELAIRAFDGYSGNPLILWNASLWTLPWEMICYLAVGLIGTAGALTAGAFPALFCAVWLVFVTNLGVDEKLFYFVATMLMMFLMGAFIALSERRISLPKGAVLAGALLALTFTKSGMAGLQWVLDAGQFAYGPNFPLGGIRQAIYIAAVPFVFLYLAVCFKPIRFMRSDLSYGVYVYAWPIQEIVVKISRQYGFAPSGLAVFFLSMPPILLMSWLSWHFIEKRALELKRFSIRKAPRGESSQQT